MLFALLYRQQSVPLAGIDAEDYAQIGRQIAEGNGFTSLFMPLNGLAFLLERGTSLEPPWPNITRFPLPPLVMALIFKVIGPSDLAASFYSLIGYLVVVPFAVLLGKKLGGWPLAVFAGGMVVLHPDAAQLSFSGLTETVSSAILIAVAWLVLRNDLRSHVIAGLVLGLGYWNRTTLIALALPVAVLLWYTAEDRKKSTGYFLGATILVALPWMIWTFILTGNPLFNLQNASVLTLGADPTVTAFGWYTLTYQAAAPSLGDTFGKWIQEFLTFYEILPAAQGFDYPGVLGPWYLLIFAIYGWLVCPEPLKPFRWLVLGWLVLQIVIYSFAGNISRFYTIFQPFVTIFGGFGILHLVSRALDRWGGYTAAAAAAFLISLPTFAAASGFQNFEGSPDRSDVFSAIVDVSLENGGYVASKTGSNDLILSNMPWSVAWRAHRPSAPIPPTPDGIAEFEQKTGLRVAALYLTPQMYIVGVPPTWSEWRELRGAERAPTGFVLDRRFRDGSMLLLRE